MRSYRYGSTEGYYEALERGLEIRYVNPRKTSSTCPRCGSKLEDNGNRVLRCTKCGSTCDRGVVTCVNLFYKYARCGVLGVALNAPKGDAGPRPMQWGRDEAMRPPNINLHES
ncbi:MAG: zinc ribbon domain-containing protein [Sulfolobales archaeon]